MAQYYTLDEAARKLGLSTDDFRRKLQTEWRTIRKYPDAGTLRFQVREIDELARTMGGGSDAEVQLGDEPLKLADDSGMSSDDFVALGGDTPDARKNPASSGRLKKKG